MLELFGVALMGVFGWAFHLESRLETEVVAREALKELILSKLDNIADRLSRIEKSMNGALRRHD